MAGDGTNYYVKNSYLALQNNDPALPVPVVIGKKTVIARVLNVRSGAGTTFSIVGKLSRGDVVEVVETVANGAWAKIKYGTGFAYVSCTYLA